jgi:hypothetical protein
MKRQNVQSLDERQQSRGRQLLSPLEEHHLNAIGEQVNVVQVAS